MRTIEAVQKTSHTNLTHITALKREKEAALSLKGKILDDLKLRLREISNVRLFFNLIHLIL
jgi:hypothetical protein